MSDSEPEFDFPSLDITDQLHLERQYNMHGRDRVIGWLKAKVAVPLRGQFDDEFDEDEYYEQMAEYYVDMESNDTSEELVECDGTCDKDPMPVDELITVPTSEGVPTRFICDDCKEKHSPSTPTEDN